MKLTYRDKNEVLMKFPAHLLPMQKQNPRFIVWRVIRFSLNNRNANLYALLYMYGIEKHSLEMRRVSFGDNFKVVFFPLIEGITEFTSVAYNYISS